MIAAFAGTAIFLIAALPLLTAGWSMLRFVTLLPLILAVGFLLRGLAPALDATGSSRPVARLLQQIDEPGRLPLATFALNRNTAFGLAFYLDRRVVPYEGLEISPAVYELPAAIPTSAHILVTREDSLPALRLLLPGARFAFSAPTARSVSSSTKYRLRRDNYDSSGHRLVTPPSPFARYFRYTRPGGIPAAGPNLPWRFSTFVTLRPPTCASS